MVEYDKVNVELSDLQLRSKFNPSPTLVFNGNNWRIETL